MTFEHLSTAYNETRPRSHATLPYAPHELDLIEDDRVRATVAHVLQLCERECAEAVDHAGATCRFCEEDV